MIHVVRQRMPGRSKSALGVRSDDINRLDACQAVDKQMVVCHSAAVFINKHFTISQFLGCFPDFLIDIRRELF